MRVSREKAEENRRQVLATAAQMFRQRGIDGIGVADLMKAVGLTHGGFYGQFESKDDLAVHATELAIDENLKSLDLALGANDPWATFKGGYLSSLHCDYPEAGCAFSALAVEASRRDGPIKTAITKGLKKYLEKLEKMMPRKRGKSAREQAVLGFSAMVGALVLARAVDDKELAKELLETVKNTI